MWSVVITPFLSLLLHSGHWRWRLGWHHEQQQELPCVHQCLAYCLKHDRLCQSCEEANIINQNELWILSSNSQNRTDHGSFKHPFTYSVSADRPTHHSSPFTSCIAAASGLRTVEGCHSYHCLRISCNFKFSVSVVTSVFDTAFWYWDWKWTSKLQGYIYKKNMHFTEGAKAKLTLFGANASLSQKDTFCASLLTCNAALA